MVTLIQILAFTGLIATGSCYVCYNDYDLGCFDTSMNCHWKNPSSPNDIGTTFTLYTRSNRYSGDVLDRTSTSSIKSSHFSSSRDTKLLVHGWTDSMSGSTWTEMRDALLDSYNVNVVMVDWSPGAGMLYTTSRANTRVVGREIARLMQTIKSATGASYSSMHTIGHSLGAHIGGYAGEALQGYTGQKIGRVTGLDPAGPEFGGDISNACRLDKTDATFVDVMHTDGDLVGLGGAGLMDELGDQDFYPNGGQDMPGCPTFDAACDHSRAHEYFTESISSSCSFYSKKKGSTWDDIKNGQTTTCTNSNCPQMGYKASLSKGTGAFYLETNGNSPYCQG